MDGAAVLAEAGMAVTVGPGRTVESIAAWPSRDSVTQLVGAKGGASFLPFPECPGAAPHVAQVVGMQVGGFRTSVQDTLRELECCTHLNDMLRCLAEVHALARHLESGLRQPTPAPR